jgi:hypothetical protein
LYSVGAGSTRIVKINGGFKIKVWELTPILKG